MDQRVQLFERGRLEAAPSGEVMAARVVVETFAPQPPVAPVQGCHYSTATGHNICGRLRQVWHELGAEAWPSQGEGERTMKRQHIAIAAALVASLIGGSYGIAQANTDGTAACSAQTGQVLLRSAAPAAANAAVTCTPAAGEAQAWMPAQEVAELTSADAAQAHAQITSAPEATGMSKAATPKDVNGQIELAAEPSTLSKAPKAKDVNGQIELATEPGHTSAAVTSK